MLEMGGADTQAAYRRLTYNLFALLHIAAVMGSER